MNASRNSRRIPANARPRTELRLQARASGKTLAPAAPEGHGPWTLQAGASLVRKYGLQATLAALGDFAVTPTSRGEVKRRIFAVRAQQNTAPVRAANGRFTFRSQGK